MATFIENLAACEIRALTCYQQCLSIHGECDATTHSELCCNQFHPLLKSLKSLNSGISSKKLTLVLRIFYLRLHPEEGGGQNDLLTPEKTPLLTPLLKQHLLFIQLYSQPQFSTNFQHFHILHLVRLTLILTAPTKISNYLWEKRTYCKFNSVIAGIEIIIFWVRHICANMGRISFTWSDIAPSNFCLFLQVQCCSLVLFKKSSLGG